MAPIASLQNRCDDTSHQHASESLALCLTLRSGACAQADGHGHARVLARAMPVENGGLMVVLKSSAPANSFLQRCMKLLEGAVVDHGGDVAEVSQ